MVTVGTKMFVLISEVSLLQEELYKVGTRSSVLMSLFQRCSLRGVPLYTVFEYM